jgi:predicted TIM-barrel fold metal-dependent hydrolase
MTSKGAPPPGEPPVVIDTHAFAFSPLFMEENELPTDIDGTFDTLVEDMDSAGVAHTIATMFVTRDDDFFESVARGIARQRPRMAAQVNLPPSHPDWAASNLRAAAREADVAGARAALSLFKMHPVDERLEKVWDECERARLPVQVVVDATKYSEPSSFDILARAHPEMPLVLGITKGRHRAGWSGLARHGRVFFQVPGLLDSEVARGDPSLLRWAVRHLPAEKIMFGSDRLGPEPSYGAKVRALASLPPKARPWVAHGTALSVYGDRLPAWRV